MEFPHVGRINLIVGKNNSGKSTVLDALRIYAEVGNIHIIETILNEKDELLDKTKYTNLPLLYTRNHFAKFIKIGNQHTSLIIGSDIGNRYVEKIPYYYIPSNTIVSNTLRDLWDNISATSYSKKVIEILQAVSPEIEALAFRKIQDKEIPFVNIGEDTLIPLKSAGEGLLRVLQLALGVINAKNGLFLLDEFENSLHYSVQTKIWKIIIELAIKLNVQIFATTHSWDCVKALQQCTEELPAEIEIFLFRLGKSMRIRDKGEIIVIEYDRQALTKITQAEFEVR